MRAPLPAALGGRWTGLVCQTNGPARPGLRVEVTSGRRLLLRQADRVVLLGVQRTMHRGVHYVRTGRYRSPLAPIRVAHARQLREASTDEDAWAARWTYQFAGLLQAASDGPLHAGHWTLAWGMPSWSVATHWQRLNVVDPDRGRITWCGYGDPDDDQRDVLPLRRLSSADAARVRSYRRQLREGVMPPALLWWVSGLNTLVVLDGHDRIAAALAEQTLPQVVVLAPAGHPPWVSAAHGHLVREYEGRSQVLQPAVHDGDAVARTHLVNITHQFAGQLNDLARIEGRTRAWPLRGGQAAWEQQAAQLAPGWDASERRTGANCSHRTPE